MNHLITHAATAVTARSIVVCLKCQERPMVFGLVDLARLDTNGEPLKDNTTGYCRECQPAQIVDRAELAQIAYESKWGSPASAELQALLAGDHDEEIAEMERIMMLIHREMVSWEHKLSDPEWSGDYVWTMNRVDDLTEQYNELSAQIIAIEQAYIQ